MSYLIRRHIRPPRVICNLCGASERLWSDRQADLWQRAHTAQHDNTTLSRILNGDTR